jgi:RimJ/RimL family protein N-acetyltransferase
MHPLLLNLPTHLDTPRLIVRAYRPGDGPLYYAAAVRNRAHLSHFESGNVLNLLRSEEEAEIAVRKMALEFAFRERFFWGVFMRDTGAWGGQVYTGIVNWALPELEIGYVADVEHEGRGCITEAARAVIDWTFGPVGARRLRLECDATNARSIRVAERCGFTLEGCLRRNHLWPDGSTTDTLCFGLLSEHFT